MVQSNDTMPAARIVVHHHHALQLIVQHTIAAKGPRCSLNHLNVGRIEFFDALFKDSPFNGDISEWDTSNAISMSQMFQGSAFNGDISSWDTGSVLSMPMMFADSAFNQTIAAWNVSKVTDFHHIPVLYIGGKASMTRTGSERIPHGASTLTES